MPVFISHRTADDAKAQALARRLLTRHNIRCYLDHFDPEARSTSEITSLIVGRINLCTHLMALVTDATVGSWWVPLKLAWLGRAIAGLQVLTTARLNCPSFSPSGR